MVWNSRLPSLEEALSRPIMPSTVAQPKPRGLSTNLQEVLGQPLSTPWSPYPENDPQGQVQGYQARLQQAGMDVPERKKRGLGNALMTAMDVIQRPQYAVMNTLLEAGKTDPSRRDYGAAIKRGLTGEQKGMGADVLEMAGVENKYVKGVGGFLMNVFLDPTTYLSAGVTGFAKGKLKLGQQGIQGLLKETGLSSVDDIAKHIGKTIGGQYGDDIIRKGINAINPDIIDMYNVAIKGKQAALVDPLKAAARARAASQGKILPGMAREGMNIGSLTSGGYADFMNKMSSLLDDYAMGGLKPLTHTQRADVVGKIFGDVPYSTAFARTLKDVGDDAFTDSYLRIASVLHDTFQGAARAPDSFIDVGKRISKVLNVTGDVDVASFTRFGKYAAKEIKNRKTLEGLESGIRLANGLEYVYNKTNKTMYMKFMGHEFLNLTDTVGAAGRKIVETSYGLPGVGKGIQRVSDALSYVFKTEHITPTLAHANPEAFGAAKDFAQHITRHLQKQTAIPRNTLDSMVGFIANNPEVLSNKKVRQAATYAVEGMARGGKGLDSASLSKWMALQETLSPRELELVKELVSQNELFSTAMQAFDKSFGVVYKPREGYIKHLFKKKGESITELASAKSQAQKIKAATETIPGAAKQRSYPSLAKAESLYKESGGLYGDIPMDDILHLWSYRLMESEIARLNVGLKNVMEEMVTSKMPGVKYILSKEQRKGFFSLQEKGFSGMYASQEVVNQINRIQDLVNNNVGAEYFKHIFDDVTNVMKQLQTSANPAFVSRNLVGETMMNWFARVDVKSHSLGRELLTDKTAKGITRIGDEVFFNGQPLIRRVTQGKTQYVEYGFKHGDEVLRGVTRGTWDDATRITASALDFDKEVIEAIKGLGAKTYRLGNHELTAYEIMQMFYDQGLGWSGISKGNLAENVQQMLTRELAQKSGGAAKKFFGAPREIADWTETWTRLSQFVDRLNKNYGIADAANDVRKFHVDYRDLTNVERNMRRIMPFYTYMRKNTPIQLRALVTEPGRINATIFKLLEASHHSLKDPQTGESPEMPDYLARRLALPLYRDNDGNVRYLNWNLPITDIARFQYSLNDLVQHNLLDMLHPGVKYPFEQAANRNISLDVELNKYEGQRASMLPGWEGSPKWDTRLDYAMQQMGLAESLRRMAGQGISQAVGEPQDPYKLHQIPLFGSFAPKRSSVHADISHAYGYRDQLQDYFRMLEEEHGIVIPQLPKTRQMGVKPPSPPKVPRI